MHKVNALVNRIKENLLKFSSQSFWDKCDSLSFLLFVLFFIDCSFSGGGKYLAIGPVTFRMIVAVSAFILSIPKLLLNLKKYIKNPIFYMFFAFLLWLIFSAVTGLKAGNNMNVLMSDLKGFMWLFTVPGLVVTVSNKKRFECILSAIVAGAFIQAMIVLCIHFGCCLLDEGIGYFYKPVFNLQIGTVNTISSTVFRIFMRSSPYMILACSIVFFRQLKEEKLRLRYIFAIVLFIFCILLSFTRSLFGGLFVVFFCMVMSVLIFYRKKAAFMLKTLASVLVAFLLCVGVMEYIFDASYLNFAVSRTFGTPVQQSLVVKAKYELKNINWQNLFDSGVTTEENSEASTEPATEKPSDEVTTDEELPDYAEATTAILTENTTAEESSTEDKNQDQIISDSQNQQDYMQQTSNSDAVRDITTQELKALIKKSPIIGNGLGACSETRNGPDEYFYYDIIARMGMIGLLLYVMPFVYVCICMLKKRAMLRSNMGAVALICGVTGFWAVTWFNPWMNAVLGIAVYALSCSIVETFNNENQNKK